MITGSEGGPPDPTFPMVGLVANPVGSVPPPTNEALQHKTKTLETKCIASCKAKLGVTYSSTRRVQALKTFFFGFTTGAWAISTQAFLAAGLPASSTPVSGTGPGLDFVWSR